jgi:hypothetical protein
VSVADALRLHRARRPPNVGKSTLANALVGAKVAIVSDRPQTTRRAVRGVATAPDGWLADVLADLPGVQKPRDVLTERMQSGSSASSPTPTRCCSCSTASRGSARRSLHRRD